MLNEYETQNTLNPKLWTGDRLKPGLRKKFLKIAKEFYAFLEIDADINDIILIGSNANYNWTEHSDIDLHVVINYLHVGDNIHLVKNYMMAKKSVWNANYPLSYQGIAIELYAQDQNEELHSSVGEYSLMKDKWVRKPSADLVSIDDSIIDQKIQPVEYEIDQLDLQDPKLKKRVESLMKRIRSMRQAGLEAQGEYSVENLAYKKLRNSGYLDRLKNLLRKATVAYLQTESVQHEDVIESLAKHMRQEKLLDEAGWMRVIKFTGGIEDEQGQWKHPGRCTMIPSSNITMHNVPHSVLGIDDTGHSIMMQPGGASYQYPGGKVFEIPITPQQRTLYMKLRNAIQNRARYAK
jgi:hypothetical protein